MTGSMLSEQAFAEMIAANGGRLFRVGGCVRDRFMGVEAKDIDLCVVGMVKKNFKNLFPEAEEYGKSFPVFRLMLDGKKCEVAFARTERKVSTGYKGFKVASNPKITIEEDLYRRDLTINAIAVDCLTGQVIDPYQGIQDIENQVLRAIGPQFAEDPIRSLRLAGQAARFGFRVDTDTLALAQTVANELANEPVERIFAEFKRVLLEASEPASFFQLLAAMKLLLVTFPEIAKLSTDNMQLAMIQLNAAAALSQDPKIRFATLGLSLTVEQLHQWNQRMTLPHEWLEAAAATGKTAELLKKCVPENLVTAVYQLNRGSLQVEDFDVLARAAQLGLPALVDLKAILTALPRAEIPNDLQGKELGKWLKTKHIEMITHYLGE